MTSRCASGAPGPPIHSCVLPSEPSRAAALRWLPYAKDLFLTILDGARDFAHPRGTWRLFGRELMAACFRINLINATQVQSTFSDFGPGPGLSPMVAKLDTRLQ